MIAAARGGRLGAVLPAAVLVAACGAFFAPLLEGQTFTTVTAHYEAVYPWKALGTPYRDVPQSDQADLTVPWRTFVSRELRRGTVPLWNPLSFGGEPFFANGSSGVLYPPNLLAALLVSPDVAHDAVSVLHVLLSGLFMYLLMREWQTERFGALFSAVAWMLSSFNLAWLHLEVVAPMAAWLPGSLWLVSRAQRRDEWTAALLGAGALACVMVSGHLLFGGVVYGTAVIYAAGVTLGRIFRLGEWRDERAGASIRPLLLRLGLIIAGPLLLGAAVIVPTVFYLGGLGRQSIGYEQVHVAIRVPYTVFRYLITPPPLPATETTMHQMVFGGTLTPLLAGVGLFIRGRGTWFARLLVVAVFLVATDTILLKVAYVVFPPFSFFSPLGRLLNLFNFGLVALAGVALDRLARRAEPKWLAHAMIAAAICVTAWQLIDYGRAINPPFVPREARWLYPPTPLIDALGSQGGFSGTAAGRVVPIRPSLRDGWTSPVLWAAEPMVFGIDSLTGYDSTLPPRAEDVIRVASGEDLAAVLGRTYRRAFIVSLELDRIRFALLPRLGATLLVAPPGMSALPTWEPARFAPLRLTRVYSGADGEIFRIEDADGGPWLVYDTAAVDGPRRAVELFTDPSFDHRRRVILEQSDLVATGLGPRIAAEQTWGAVRNVEDGINTLRLTITASHAGWLVVPNVWERGWSATVNGERAPVLRANYAFQAVPVPPGDSEVRLSYSPPGLIAGIAVNLIAVASLMISVVAQRRSSARRSARSTGHLDRANPH